jgi:hypothetical protein
MKIDDKIKTPGGVGIVETINDVKAIERVESLLSLLKVDGDAIFKIIGLVQDHADFFNVRMGHRCLQAAATKLEQLVRENVADKLYPARGSALLALFVGAEQRRTKTQLIGHIRRTQWKSLF